MLGSTQDLIARPGTEVVMLSDLVREVVMMVTDLFLTECHPPCVMPGVKSAHLALSVIRSLSTPIVTPGVSVVSS